ncbi:ZinT/AdcA family metal-binding protein [Enterococcus sp. BWT-B8]|uniref:zinc ABC transporter substrate-binding protein AdcA n=1 Tax=Enterococcus sp. BWT-B8 TaxID=2885157 RepID=UPI001E4F9069|nr:zinc ABC transporter substrate-binding protein AdcA [Enterococcus sp. BWT-B8]MCB5951447.1 ZinT/AdcA family metal-binding protein [Enterococcus sp. BWT-B8]
MKRKLILGLSILFLAGFMSACSVNGKGSSVEEQKELNILTSFYPMYEFTKNIVGNEGTVDMLVPAGTEAHDYEPSAKDLKKLQDADVFVYNNENMEFWVPSMETTFNDGDVHVIKATENMLLLSGGEEEDHDHSEEDGHSHELDPHVWLAPSLAIEEVKEIRDQLIEIYPEREAVFTENTEAYLKRLTDLDHSYKDTLGAASQKSFVTQHAAFGYLAVEYGLTQVPISGLSPSEEPSATRLAELKDFVTENDIQYIYFEANATDSIARTLAEEAGVELLVLNPLEGLTNEQIENGEDYISVMADNLEALSKTITGENSALDSVSAKKEKTVYNGYFEDSQIKDRPLSDWSGSWQSVYPFVSDGTFDQVFDYKAKINKDKTAEEYKAYYEAGYTTDIEKIEITNNKMTFINSKGEHFSSEYKYAGYEVLSYKGGNRGVRYCFEALDQDNGAFRYVQFSDHAIEPTKAEHFHIYFGNESQEALSSELENWPTYYSADLSGKEIAQEMLAH